MPSDASVAPPDGGLQQPIDLSFSRRDRNGNRNGNENHSQTEEPLNLCVPNNRRHVVRCSNSRSQRRKRRRLERMVNHLRKCSNSPNLAPNAAPSCGGGDDEEQHDDDDDDDAGDDVSDDEGKVGGASIRNPLLARTLGGLLAEVPNWSSGGATSYIPRSFYSNCGQSKATPSTVAASLPVTVGGAQALKLTPLSSSSCTPPSSPSPPPTSLSQLQGGPSAALMTANNAAGSRKRTQRALTGKHVKQGTGASPATLLTLRHKIEQRRQQQRGARHRGGVGFHDGGAISRSIAAKKNCAVAPTTRKKKAI